MKKQRSEYGRPFRLVEAVPGPYYVNTDTGEVRVIPPPEGRGVTSWIVHALSTSRRGETRAEVTEPGAEKRAFALAAGIIGGIFSIKDD